MTWAAGFVSALGAPKVLMRFALVRIALWDEYTPGGSGPVAILSHPDDPMLAAAYPAALVAALDVGNEATLATTEGELDCRASRGGGSGLSVQVIGVPGVLRAFMVQFPAGAACELVAFVSDDGGTTWLDEVVFTGRVRSMMRVGVRLDVDILGLDSCLFERLNASSTYGGAMLVKSGGTPTDTLKNAYTTGDTHIDLDHAPPWGAPAAGIKYAVVVEHSPTPWAATYTGVATSPHRVTGVPSVSTVSTSASALSGGDVVDYTGRPSGTYKERIAIDPPLANVSSGTVARFPAYYSGHPLAVLMRILTSRGSLGPANGADDVLPYEWALGVDRGLIDATDVASEQAGTSGALIERIEELRDLTGGVDGAAFIEELLAQAGFFLAMRNGRLTARAVPSPYGTLVSVAVAEEDLACFTSQDVGQSGDATPVQHDPWPAAWPFQVTVQGVTNANGTHLLRRALSGAAVLASAVRGSQIAVLTDRWGPATGADSAVTEWDGRMWPAMMLIPEVYTLSLAGLHWARLTKGDWLTLTLPAEISRQGAGLVDGLLALVLSVSVDWLGGVVRVTCAAFEPEEPTTTIILNDYGD